MDRDENPILFLRPSLWDFFWYISICWIVLPLGLIYIKKIGAFESLPSIYWKYSWYFVIICAFVALIIILWDRATLKFYVYSDRVVLERGVLSKEYKEIFIKDIRTIDVRQSLIQRIVNIGEISIASAGTSGYEINAKGIPAPRKARNLILSLRDNLVESED